MGTEEKKEDEMSRRKRREMRRREGKKKGEKATDYPSIQEPRSWSAVMSDLNACFQVFPLKTSTD